MNHLVVFCSPHGTTRHVAELGAGHPDREDDRAVEELVDAVVERAASGGPALPLAGLDYQPARVAEAMRARDIRHARERFPDFGPDAARCDRCGACVEACPAGALTLDPEPRRGDDCFLCLTCVRACPQEAIPLDLSPLSAFIRKRAAELDEQPATEVYL